VYRLIMVGIILDLGACATEKCGVCGGRLITGLRHSCITARPQRAPARVCQPRL